MLELRVLRSVLWALFYYILYYLCQILVGFLGMFQNAVLLTLLGSAMFLGAVAIIMGVRRKNAAEELCIMRVPTVDILRLMFLGVAFNIVCVIVMAFIPFPEAWMKGYVDASSQIQGNGLLLDIAFMLIVAPITEEVLFRGLVYGNLARGVNKYIAAVIAAVLFGAAHGQIVWIIYASVLGLVLVWVFDVYRSLIASVAFHFGFNILGCLSSLIRENDTAVAFMSMFYFIIFVPSLFYIIFTVVQKIKSTKKRKDIYK